MKKTEKKEKNKNKKIPEPEQNIRVETMDTMDPISNPGRLKARSLGSFKENHPEVMDAGVNDCIKKAYNRHAFFYFYPDWQLIKKIEGGVAPMEYAAELSRIKEDILNDSAREDNNIRTRFGTDVRLITRLISAVEFFHMAAVRIQNPELLQRRIVIIKEEKGVSTIYKDSDGANVLAHVGSGPPWEEVPSIYLGLTTFDVLKEEKKQGGDRLFRIFCRILELEERAIETGYFHSVELSEKEEEEVAGLLTALDEYISLETPEPAEEVKDIASARFTHKDRERILRLLDSRVMGDVMNYDYDLNLTGIEILEELASRYKSLSDSFSLREVVRLLVSASGHDLHEIRNRASIALERIFSPREYEAPLATRFINGRAGIPSRIDFELPDPGQDATYFVRVYHSNAAGEIFLNRDLDFTDRPLEHLGENLYYVDLEFADVSQKDILVFRKTDSQYEWVTEYGASVRLNVMPDLRGEIVLEIFTDIHGHTGVYWKNDTEHPGLVYNENGEVIRLGRFSDVAAHLPDIKQRYMITAIYLLGVQTRGSNRGDWASNATSPSPFSPLSLTEIEEFLGGEDEFQNLVDVAHSLDIKVIVDVIPHLNRMSEEVPDRMAIQCYDGSGNLVYRASTDGRYGSWNDGRLLNYRMFEVWEWLAGSIVKLIEKFGIDGIRFDSAHAVPIMMKKNNFPHIYDKRRTVEEMVEGNIIVNDVEYGHFITTGYYDAACRDMIAVPTHYFLMLQVERTLRRLNKNFFVYLAECYWGHERFLARSGVVPYNSALFKICENIIHGKSDVREIYHVYDHYFPASLPSGTAMLGILGNHDERRGLNTFGHRGVRAATALTLFMSEIVLDYEGSAEGEGWKVFLDNIYVNWNQFEFAAHRSLEPFYREWYAFHRRVLGPGHMVWANNHHVAAALKFSGENAWIGAFNFSDSNQQVSIQFDNPALNIPDDAYYVVEDPLYSPITTHYNYYTGRELKVSRLNTTVSYTDRVKLLSLKRVEDPSEFYYRFLFDSFQRLCRVADAPSLSESFAYREIMARIGKYETFVEYVRDHLIGHSEDADRSTLELGLKRVMFHAFQNGVMSGDTLLEYMERLAEDSVVGDLGKSLKMHNEKGAFVFLSAEAEPFSRSGGLGNVVYELPRELVKQDEKAYVITGYYRHGDEKGVRKMRDAAEKYGVKYTGVNIRFKILDADYEIGVHSCEVEGVVYYLLDHYEFFDGLYWGYTAAEKLRKRVAFARASAEIICTFGLKPHFVLTNDAFAGLFAGIIRSDPVYYNNDNFQRSTYLHMIHNGGWQYFDAYERWENGFDLFSLFNTPEWKVHDFIDPVHWDRLNCMAAGIRFSDRVITVSPSYARQIEYACDGLEGILNNVIGISNAIGSDFLEKMLASYEDSDFVRRNYAPVMERIKGDKELSARVERLYPEILEGLDPIKNIRDPDKRNGSLRLLNKMMLQHERGFEVSPDRILVSMIHRITEQKGFQLLLESSERIFRELGFQAIIGGAVSPGDKKGEQIAHGLWLLTQYFPQQVSVGFGFQDVSIPLLSSDLFLMPSMSEPGGIAQLEAFACGSLVVARATGGLRDTVHPIFVDSGVNGNGFLFSDYNAGSFFDAMKRAHDFFRDSGPEIIHDARRNAEKSVYYWDRPARRYVEELYNIKEIIRVLK